MAFFIHNLLQPSKIIRKQLSIRSLEEFDDSQTPRSSSSLRQSPPNPSFMQQYNSPQWYQAMAYVNMASQQVDYRAHEAVDGNYEVVIGNFSYSFF
ncbi:unnamed protein product [Thelazia callipaeda]|uniref:SCP domain-containing protein n=1 Tax=Thelazia callipaeda TaxID=103827 RepID=A0A0N5D1X4_THECL|nr:unnamed protein product [Thelazia callipaeda]